MPDYENRPAPSAPHGGEAGRASIAPGKASLTAAFVPGAPGKHTLTAGLGTPTASGTPGKQSLTERLASTPSTPETDTEFVDQWFREHVHITNQDFQSLERLLPAQRDGVMRELERRYGHEYVRRGLAGELDESTPPERVSEPIDAAAYWSKYGEKTMQIALNRAMSELAFDVVGPGLSFSSDECGPFVMYGFGWRMGDVQVAAVSHLLDCPLLPLIDGARIAGADDRAADAYEPAIVEKVLERLGLGVRRATERLALPYAKARARAVADAEAVTGPRSSGSPSPIDPRSVQPSSQALGARTPIEHAVADSLCSGVVGFDPVAFGLHPDATIPGAEAPGEPRPCRLELARGRGDWMTVRVLEATDATAADVAAELYGGPQFTQLVVGTGDHYSFVFPPGGELAEPYETQWTNHLLIDEDANLLEMGHYRSATDPVLGLDDKLAEQRALESAAGRAADGHGAAPVLQRLEIMTSVMDDIERGAAPLGVAPIVHPMQARIAARREVCSADPAEAERWAAHSSVQLELLTEAKVGLDAITQQLAAMGAPGRSTAEGDELVGDVTESMQAPTREVTAAYAGVVAASDQLDVGRERLELAKERMAAYPFDMVDRMLAVIRGRIASTSNHATIPMQSYDRQRLDALQIEIAGTVAQLRVAVVNGDGTAVLRLQTLRSQLSMLDLQSALGATVSSIHELKGQLLASESMHPDWQRRDRIWDRLHAAIGPWLQLAAEYDQLWQAGREQDPGTLAAARYQLGQLRATTELPKLVADVTSFAEDEAERQRWIAIGIMIGAALVAAVTGGLASGAIGGAAGALVGAGMEGLTFTVIMSTLQRDQTFGGFVAELGLNIATFGGMRAISGGAKLLAGGKPLSLGAKLGEMTLEALWGLASVKAQEEIERIFKRGGTVTTQGAATVFGHQLLASFAARALARATSTFVEGVNGVEKIREGQAALALRGDVEQLAQKVLTAGDDTVGEALAKADTASLHADVTAFARVRELAANPAEAARLGITLEAGALEKLEAAARGATREITEREISDLMRQTTTHDAHVIAEPAVYADLVNKHRALGSSVVDDLDTGGQPCAKIKPSLADGSLGTEITLHSRLGDEVEKILADKGLPNTPLVADYFAKRAQNRAEAIEDLRRVSTSDELDALLERTLGKEAVAVRKRDLAALATGNAPAASSQIGENNPALLEKLKRAGVPDPAAHADTARVLRQLDKTSEKWLEELLDLEHAGRVRGISDWFATIKRRASDDQINDMLRELREAHRLIHEHPTKVITVGADIRAPRKPVAGRKNPSIDEIDASFDIEASIGASVARSVEVKTYSNPVRKADDLMDTVEAAADKAIQRQRNGQPIPGDLELRIDMHFYKGVVGKSSKRGGNVYTSYDGRGGYGLRHKETDAPILDSAGNAKGGDALEEMTGSLNDKPKASILNQVTLVNEHGIIAIYKNETGTWTRIQ